MPRLSEIESLRKWFEYNARARKSYIATFSKLPPEDLSRDRGASFPTLLDIFQHSLDGTSLWIGKMSVLHGTLNSGYDCPENPSLSDISRYNEEIGKEVDDFFSHLTEEDLNRTYLVPKLPPWWNEDFDAPVRETLYHLVEHELQHRGELNALLWQIDVDPPILDFLFDYLPAETRRRLSQS
jgi:uncharacterized damage-inducible protein DinB